MQQEKPQDSSPNHKHKRLITIAIIAAAVIVLAIIAIIIFNATRSSPASKDQQEAKPLTIGSQPYIYPCSVATRQDYARIFGLDDDKVGTVTERSALSQKDLKEGGDLSKIAPSNSSDPRYSADCSYTLAKKGATQVNRIDIELWQFASDEQAAKELNSARNRAAGLFLSDEKAQLPALPSFTTENSYVKAPEADDISEEAGLLVGSRFVEIEYRLTGDDSAASVTPLLDAYAKTIKAKLDGMKKSEPTDLTGHDTFVGTKFVDICRKTDLSRLAKIFNDIEFRPDEVTDISTYGSLQGSRAAADGAKSDCLLDFNSSEDRKKIAELDDKPKKSKYDRPLSSGARWQHGMTLALNTFGTSGEAKAAFDNKRVAAGKSTANATSDVKDVTGVGDAAYKLTRTIDNSLEKVGGGMDVRTSTETSLVVVKDKDLYVVSLQQLSVSDDYQTTPVEVNDDKLKAAFKLIADAVKENRS